MAAMAHGCRAFTEPGAQYGDVPFFGLGEFLYLFFWCCFLFVPCFLFIYFFVLFGLFSPMSWFFVSVSSLLSFSLVHFLVK